MFDNPVLSEIMLLPFLDMGSYIAILTEEMVVKCIYINNSNTSISFNAGGSPWSVVSISTSKIVEQPEGGYKNDALSEVFLKKKFGKYVIFKEENQPVLYGGLNFLSPTTIDEGIDSIIFGRNCVRNISGKLDFSSIGYSIFHLENELLTLLNKELIPFLIWSAWREGENIILAGMTFRTKLPPLISDGEEENFARGRPVVIRYLPYEEKWSEIQIIEGQEKELQFLSTCNEKFASMPNANILRFESWIGSQIMPDGDRWLLAGFGEQRMPIFDALCVECKHPTTYDFESVAIFSWRKRKFLNVFSRHQFLGTLSMPGRKLFVLKCIENLYGAESEFLKISQLFLFDPFENGEELRQIEIHGLPSDVLFRNNFQASYFEKCGYFGVLETIEDKCYFIQSENGLRWKYIKTLQAAGV